MDKQIVSVWFAAAIAGRACSLLTNPPLSFHNDDTRHFGVPNFHLVEFAKTLTHNVKIQSKFMYGFILY